MEISLAQTDELLSALAEWIINEIDGVSIGIRLFDVRSPLVFALFLCTKIPPPPVEPALAGPDE